MDNIFAGKDGYVWWFGRVMSVSDTMGLGRIQVFIEGWHNDDEEQLPPYALPWASVVYSPNSNTTATMQVGDRVMGFFLDGMVGQQPCVTGRLLGQSVTSNLVGSQTVDTPSKNDPNFGKALTGTGTVERDDPTGNVEEAQTINTVPNVRKLENVNPGEWSVPFTGFVSDKFGTRSGHHKGVDICCAGYYPQLETGAPHTHDKCLGPTNLPVYAAADGVVLYIFRKTKPSYDENPALPRSYGNAIVLKHNLSNGVFITIYAHLGVNQDPAHDDGKSGILVKVGDTVKKGQQIGTIGRTHVRDTPTHLHFEIARGVSLPKHQHSLNPADVFPQMGEVHGTQKSWVWSNKYNATTWKFGGPDNAPVKAGDPPKIV